MVFGGGSVVDRVGRGRPSQGDFCEGSCKCARKGGGVSSRHIIRQSILSERQVGSDQIKFCFIIACPRGFRRCSSPGLNKGCHCHVQSFRPRNGEALFAVGADLEDVGDGQEGDDSDDGNCG